MQINTDFIYALQKNNWSSLKLPWVRAISFVVHFCQKSGHIDAVRVMLLAELEAGGHGQPWNELSAISNFDFVSALEALRSLHVTNDLHISFFLKYLL